jgi:hypothetical protein
MPLRGATEQVSCQKMMTACLIVASITPVRHERQVATIAPPPFRASLITGIDSSGFPCT